MTPQHSKPLASQASGSDEPLRTAHPLRCETCRYWNIRFQGEWDKNCPARKAQHSVSAFEGYYHEFTALVGCASHSASDKVLKSNCQFYPCGMTIGVGFGDKTSSDGGLFVHGSYESIKEVQRMIFELEELRQQTKEP
jgi:hypothetical protein